MAQDSKSEQVNRQLAEDRKVRDRAFADYTERMKGKPTPTQEENDRAALGEHVLEHEDDGSGPDPNVVSPEDADKIAARSRAEYAERTKGKPTPTQEENDRAAKGEHVTEHEDDGSGPDNVTTEQRHQQRHMEARPTARPASYQTRTMRPSSSE